MAISACATLGAVPPTLPSTQPQRALARDIERIVDSREQFGWQVDEIETRNVLNDALMSACRVPETARAETLWWFDAAISDAGGPVTAAYERAGRDVSEVKPLLLLERSRAVLAEADRWARDGKCPFWTEPEPDFAGLQDENGKFLLSLETGGRFYAQREGSNPGFGGGGAGRFLMGWGFSDRFSLLGGLEAGGGARFTDLRLGAKSEFPLFILVGAMPVIARFHFLSQYMEIEAGPMGYVNQVSAVIQPGLRAGAGFGVSRIRLRGVMPAVVVTVGYDYAPRRADRPPVHQLSTGFRAAFSLGL